MSRWRILDAAREVFFRDGFVNANLDEVAVKSGLSKGSIYRHFPNKAALYVRVLLQTSQDFTEGYARRAAASNEQPALERILDLARYYLDYWIENPNQLRIYWALDNEMLIGELPPELVSQVEQAWSQNLAVLKRVIDEGVQRGELIKTDSENLSYALWVLATSIIEQDSRGSRKRVRGSTLEAAYFTAIELMVRGALDPDSRAARAPSTLHA